MKIRTVILEVEIEGDTPDAISLRDEVRRTKGRLLGERWRVTGAEVLEERQGAA